jgi:hypothetical protein
MKLLNLYFQSHSVKFLKVLTFGKYI